MSSRYALYQTDKLHDRFTPTTGLPKGIKPRYNISPISRNPVVIQRDGKSVVESMIWGFIPKNAKDTNSVFRYKTFNVREEDIFKKVTWEKAIRQTRCLVPVNGFYLFKKNPQGKTPYFLHMPGNALFALAGVYSSWTDPAGVEHGMYSVITTESHDAISRIERRAPVIVSKSDEQAWLDGSIDDMTTLYSIMRPYQGDELIAEEVGDAVTSPKAEHPKLITPVA